MNKVKRRRPVNQTHTPRFGQVKYYIRDSLRNFVPVCQKTFLGVLGISKDRAIRVMRNYFQTGELPKERRGGDRKKLLYQDKKVCVIDFINKLIDSNYQIEDPTKKCLPSDLNVRKMWRMYSETTGTIAVKESYFRSPRPSLPGHLLKSKAQQKTIETIMIEDSDMPIRERDARSNKSLNVPIREHDTRSNTALNVPIRERDARSNKSLNSVDELSGSSKDRRKKYACYVCMSKFATSEELNTHKQSHTEETNETETECIGEKDSDYSDSEANESESETDNDVQICRQKTNKNLPFKCESCKVVFRTLNNLRAHKSSSSSSDVICTLSCSWCERNFESTNSLLSHVVIHTIDSLLTKFFVCEKCKQAFENYFNLREHEIVSHSLKPNTKADEAVDENKENELQSTKDVLGNAQPIETIDITCELCYDVCDTINDFTDHMEFHKQLAVTENETLKPTPPKDAIPTMKDFHMRIRHAGQKLRNTSNVKLVPRPPPTKLDSSKLENKSPLTHYIISDCIPQTSLNSGVVGQNRFVVPQTFTSSSIAGSTVPTAPQTLVLANNVLEKSMAGVNTTPNAGILKLFETIPSATVNNKIAKEARKNIKVNPFAQVKAKPSNGQYKLFLNQPPVLNRSSNPIATSVASTSFAPGVSPNVAKNIPIVSTMPINTASISNPVTNFILNTQNMTPNIQAVQPSGTPTYILDQGNIPRITSTLNPNDPSTQIAYFVIPHGSDTRPFPLTLGNSTNIATNKASSVCTQPILSINKSSLFEKDRTEKKSESGSSSKQLIDNAATTVFNQPAINSYFVPLSSMINSPQLATMASAAPSSDKASTLNTQRALTTNKTSLIKKIKNPNLHKGSAELGMGKKIFKVKAIQELSGTKSMASKTGFSSSSSSLMRKKIIKSKVLQRLSRLSKINTSKTASSNTSASSLKLTDPETTIIIDSDDDDSDANKSIEHNNSLGYSAITTAPSSTITTSVTETIAIVDDVNTTTTTTEVAVASATTSTSTDTESATTVTTPTATDIPTTTAIIAATSSSLDTVDLDKVDESDATLASVSKDASKDEDNSLVSVTNGSELDPKPAEIEIINTNEQNEENKTADGIKPNDKCSLTFPRMCDSCSVVFQRLEVMQDHEKSKYKCSKCPFACCSFKDFKPHCITDHKIYCCGRCPFLATSQRQLGYHSRDKHYCGMCKNHFADTAQHKCGT